MELVYDWMMTIIVYATINSMVTAGFLKTIKRLIAKPDQEDEAVRLPRKFSVAFTFLCAYAFTFYFQGSYSIWQILINGMFVGAVSTLVYEAVLKSLIDLIPSIFNRFLGK